MKILVCGSREWDQTVSEIHVRKTAENLGGYSEEIMAEIMGGDYSHVSPEDVGYFKGAFEVSNEIISDVLSDFSPDNPTIIHGAARGVDRTAGYIAMTFGYEVETFPALWTTYGKQAGFIRNNQMLSEKPDLVIAFWDGASKGTRHTITEARKREIPVQIFYPTEGL